jgi:hypothetical protein
VITRSIIFRDLTPYSLINVYRRLRGAFCLVFNVEVQDREGNGSNNHSALLAWRNIRPKKWKQKVYANIGKLLPVYMVSYPRR